MILNYSKERCKFLFSYYLSFLLQFYFMRVRFIEGIEHRLEKDLILYSL